LLAGACGADESALYRVLRLLAALDVIAEVSPRSFGLTSRGSRLRSDSPASMRSCALIHGTFGGCRPHEHFLHAVRTGEPGFVKANGMPLFDFLAAHPEDAAIFNAAILRRHPHLRGTLFELPAVAATAEPVLAEAGVLERCAVTGGDFLHSAPPESDCCLLANVLHDWDDGTAVRILAGCRAAAAGNSRVLIIERLIPDDLAQAVPALLSDINMLVVTGGRERTNDEYCALLRAAGIRPGAIWPVTPPYGIIEGLML
jgi:hypothetical protein